MIVNLLEVLRKALRNDKLSSNGLLQYTYNVIEKSRDLPSLIQILAYNPDSNFHIDLKIGEPAEHVNDYRVKRLMLNSVRKFACKDANEFFGVRFTYCGKPISSVFLGSNGVGKSSLYAALEMSSMHYMYSAKARGYGSIDAQEYYLRNVVSPLTPHIILETGKKNIEYPEQESPVVVPAFFCSDYDIQYLERNDITEEYLCEQLGLTKIKGLLELFQRVKDLWEKNKQYLDLKSKLKRAKKDKNHHDNDDEVSQILDQINDFKASLNRDNYPDLDNFELKPEIAVLAEPIIGFISSELTEDIDLAYQYLKGILPTIVNDYFFSKEGKIAVNRRTDLSLSIDIECKSKGGNVQMVSPRMYLNTFRFKLFGVALKLGLACCAKKINHCNFPIVIDDVFDSSDFPNRSKINTFIENVVKRHNAIFSSEEYTLQLIFFTQDELVGENVYKGIRKVCDVNNVKMGRIYEYTEAKESDKSVIGIGAMYRNVHSHFIDVEDLIYGV